MSSVRRQTPACILCSPLRNFKAQVSMANFSASGVSWLYPAPEVSGPGAPGDPWVDVAISTFNLGISLRSRGGGTSLFWERVTKKAK